jgi:hypothetical protein
MWEQEEREEEREYESTIEMQFNTSVHFMNIYLIMIELLRNM